MSNLSKNSYIITGAFLVAIGGISVGSLLAKDREFSPNENRYLSGLPKCSVERILSGDFQDDLEKYLNDQILGRDQWITAKTALQKTCGDTDIGGAYVGKDGYDFEKILPEDIDDKLVNRNIQSVQQFLEKSTAQVEKDHMSFLLVPTSGLVMKEYLPKNAILFDQEAYMDRQCWRFLRIRMRHSLWVSMSMEQSHLPLRLDPALPQLPVCCFVPHIRH